MIMFLYALDNDMLLCGLRVCLFFYLFISLSQCLSLMLNLMKYDLSEMYTRDVRTKHYPRQYTFSAVDLFRTIHHKTETPENYLNVSQNSAIYHSTPPYILPTAIQKQILQKTGIIERQSYHLLTLWLRKPQP
jgi:hypothetical protein